MAGKPRTRSGRVCGAKNRRGLPCQSKLLLKGKRCRFHGGLSSGPRTPEGRAAIVASNQRRRGEKRPSYVRKPKTPPAPPPDPWVSITELMARSPESVEHWRRIVREELEASGAAEPTTETEARTRRREATILAVQRRAAWLAGELELIEATRHQTDGTNDNPCC